MPTETTPACFRLVLTSRKVMIVGGFVNIMKKTIPSSDSVSMRTAISLRIPLPILSHILLLHIMADGVFGVLERIARTKQGDSFICCCIIGDDIQQTRPFPARSVESVAFLPKSSGSYRPMQQNRDMHL